MAKRISGRQHCPFCGAPERKVMQPVCCLESQRADDALTWGRLDAGRKTFLKAEPDVLFLPVPAKSEV